MRGNNSCNQTANKKSNNNNNNANKQWKREGTKTKQPEQKAANGGYFMNDVCV